ncbi:MAG: type IV pilin protein [Patescibacteria group bacterium]|jgi:prepilin-type N-terminal cleavage/methylation domain-containing protein
MTVQKKSSGFTLIELLIVVTLIGILSVAVLSALNPLEQINKTRDAGRRADANQILSALERYYASTQTFPWNSPDFSNAVPSVNDSFLGRVDMIGVGICGADSGGLTTASGFNATGDGCSIDSTGDYGLLIKGEELKPQFAKRRAFRNDHTIPEDEMFIIKPENDPSITVCFVPSSKATRNTWNQPEMGLKFITVADDDDDGHYEPTDDTVDTCANHFKTEPTWASDDPEQWCFVCIPEE